MANPRQRLYRNLRRGAVAVKNSGKTAKAPRGRSFRKGASGNPRGRPKGAQNKATREVKALAKGFLKIRSSRRRCSTKRDAGNWRRRS